MGTSKYRTGNKCPCRRQRSDCSQSYNEALSLQRAELICSKQKERVDKLALFAIYFGFIKYKYIIAIIKYNCYNKIEFKRKKGWTKWTY